MIPPVESTVSETLESETPKQVESGKEQVEEEKHEETEEERERRETGKELLQVQCTVDPLYNDTLNNSKIFYNVCWSWTKM